jgi:hypothetical protein
LALLNGVPHAWLGAPFVKEALHLGHEVVWIAELLLVCQHTANSNLNLYYVSRWDLPGYSAFT